MLNLLDALENFEVNNDYALAIITKTEGSTYRKAGTLMLIEPNGAYWGLLSGGCLEGDVVENSKQVFGDKKDLKLSYDMRGDEDLLWGLGLGCEGAIDVLVKYLPASDNHLGFFSALKELDRGQDHKLTLQLDANNALHIQPASRAPENQACSPLRDSKWDSDNNELVINLKAPLKLLLCGASPDVVPVTEIAKSLGWKTWVIDHRKALATEKQFPQANQVNHIKRSEWESFSLTEFDAAVVMSHQFERDQDYLTRLLASDIRYIGLLGPRKRRDKLLKECNTDFDHQEGRVFGPVGLDIGAGTPQTIALAILAEIQAVLANKNARFCYQDITR
ncbi:XdhC family protein [Aliikangiella sp. G2MR2-5]|uniref:XdhC family protein n=1 Tax=Aliikangiella sp. G2MR2-5 TaxID=2788943 RepID=UPI0018ABF81B|nr:XdhC/CoxI family protein [Aliikangiella sp. G2MR2-5]